MRSASYSTATTTTERLICPGWETFAVPVSQPGTPGRDKSGSFCPGSGNRDKRLPFVPVGNTNRDKRCCQRHVAGAPFCQLVLPTGTKGSFFLFSFSQFFFYFNYTFAFQLNLCIGNSVCMISTNIYIYI